ncbi:MAG: hypothetical protein WA776_00070 [Xanthobacteraceae bacterium]
MSLLRDRVVGTVFLGAERPVGRRLQRILPAPVLECVAPFLLWGEHAN